jgi:uncharacterized membrane protein YjjP (DUF1212 family)
LNAADPENKTSPEAVRRGAGFLMKLATALHVYGMPAHRLEVALDQISKRMKIDGQFMVTPTAFFASIGPPESPQTFLRRCPPGRINLGKQTELHKLICDVGDRRLTLEQAVEVLDSLSDRTGLRGRLASVAGFSLAAGATAVFFDGGAPEAAAAALIGLAVGALVQIASHSRRLAMVLPALAGLTAVLMGGLSEVILSPSLGSVFLFVPILAGLIILIPSLKLTIAVNELAHDHLMSGTARLGGALMSFLQIAFGVALGNKLVAWFGISGASQPDPLPRWALAVALLVAAVASTLLFRARKRDLPVILTTISVSFCASRLGALAFGPELGVLLGAWLMATCAHLLGRWRNHPSAVGILPGILPLLPGGLGFRTFSSLMAADVVDGVQAGVTMLFVALSLVTGLLLASLTARAREGF